MKGHLFVCRDAYLVKLKVELKLLFCPLLFKIKNGTLNLYDIFVLNEVINYKERLQEEARRKALRESAIRKKV